MPLLQRSDGPALHYLVDDHSEPWREPRTVLLQHGYARSARFWHAWVPHLSRHHCVMRPELRGHGGSSTAFDPRTGSTIEHYVADVIALLDAMKLDRVDYCGESFGGIIGMALAALHPQRVRTLTLVASPVYQDQASQDAYAAGFPAREQALRTLGTAGWARAVYGAPGFLPDGTDPRLREWYVGEISRTDPEVLCGLYGMLRTATAEAFLPLIRAPVLGLYPTSGLLTNPVQEGLLVRGIANLRMIHLPTRSHAILTLFPDECARHLLDFMARHQ